MRAATPHPDDLMFTLRDELFESVARHEHEAIAWSFTTPTEVRRVFDDGVLVRISANGQPVATPVALRDVLDARLDQEIEILGAPTPDQLAFQAIAIAALEPGDVAIRLEDGSSESLICVGVEVEDYRGLAALPLSEDPIGAGIWEGRRGSDIAVAVLSPAPTAPTPLRDRWKRAVGLAGNDLNPLIASSMAMMAGSPVNDAGMPWVHWRLIGLTANGRACHLRKSAPSPGGAKTRAAALQTAVMKSIENSRPNEAYQKGQARRRVESLDGLLAIMADESDEPDEMDASEGDGPTNDTSSAAGSDADGQSFTELLAAQPGSFTTAHRDLLEQMAMERRVTDSGLSPSQAAADVLGKSPNTLKAQLKDLRKRARKKT